VVFTEIATCLSVGWRIECWGAWAQRFQIINAGRPAAWCSGQSLPNYWPGY